MSLIESLFAALAAPFGVPRAAVASFFASGRLSRPSGSALGFPNELIPIGARLWARGWHNKHALDVIGDWVLPYWANRQSDPASSAFVPRSLNPVSLNVNQRDWTMVGNPERAREALIDPRGLVTPWFDGWSLDTWVEVEGERVFPSRLAEDRVQQSLHENLPLVSTSYDVRGLRVRVETFAVQTGDREEWVICAATVENPRGAPRRAALVFSIRPFNAEGISPIERISYKTVSGASETGVFDVNGALALVVPPPAHIGFSSAARGDIAAQLDSLQGGAESRCPEALATAAARYDLELAPNSSRTVAVCMPMTSGQGERVQGDEVVVPAALSPDKAHELREETVQHWRALADRGMKLTLPDGRMMNAFEASKAYLLLLHDGDTITPGPYLYHHFWIRDAAYMLTALDKLGYHDAVTQVCRALPRRVQKDGFFRSQMGEWDANGQAIWTLVEHARLSGDWDLLREQYYTLLNMAHWIDMARQRTKTLARTPHWGLLPSGFSAEHLGPSDFFYWDDFWGLAGLRDAAWTADLFGLTRDAAALRSQYDAFRADVDASLAEVARGQLAPYMPASPYRRADSAMVGSLVSVFPANLIHARDPRVEATLVWLRENAWCEDTLYHGVGHTALGTYLALHIAQCYLARRSPAAWPMLEWQVRHASPVWTWAEGLSPITRHGGMGDGVHGWSAADWVHALRNMMLMEEGTTLTLTPALPHEWTAETTVLKVERAATYFGDVDLTLAFGDHAATLLLTAKWRQRPEWIEWNFPFAIQDAGGEIPGITAEGSLVRIPVTADTPGKMRIVAMW